MTAPIFLVDNRLDLFDLLAALAQLPAAQPQPETSSAEYVLTVGELVAMEAGTSELAADKWLDEVDEIPF